MKWTIYIPTKSRLKFQKTYELLRGSGIENIYLVVEPQEYDEAVGLGYPCIVLDKNDMGIRYARNWLLRYFESNGIERAVVIDDDITNLGVIGDNRYIYGCYLKDILKDAEKLPGLVTLKAYMEPDNFRSNIGYELYKGFFAVMIYNCIYIPKGFQIRDDGILEDYEQYIQLVLENNVKIYRLNKYFYSTQNCGSLGGNSENYDSELIEDMRKKALELYPEFMVENRNCHYKVSIDFKKFEEFVNHECIYK